MQRAKSAPTMNVMPNSGEHKRQREAMVVDLLDSDSEDEVVITKIQRSDVEASNRPRSPQVPLAAPDSLQEGEPPRTTPRQASRPHPLWGELSGPSGLHRFHRPAVHARMLAPGLGMGYGLGALNASVAASATAANEAAANGHCGSQGTSAHGMSSPLRAFKAGRGINTEQDQGPAGTVMDRPRTLLPRSLLPSQRRALHNRSQTIDLRSPDGEGGGQQGRQLPGNSPANMTGQADQAGELASQGLTDEELAAKLQAEEDGALARAVALQMTREEEARQEARIRARMDALQAMEEAAEQAAAAAAEGRDGSYGESMGLRPSCRRTRSARNPAGALPGGAMLGGWSAFREMSGLLPFAPSARFAAPSMGFLDLPWMGEIGGEGGHAGSEGDSRAGRGRSGGAGAHRGHRGSHHSSLREMLRGAARCGLPPNLLLSDRDFSADDYEALCRLDDSVENRKGASQAEINALPVHVIKTDAQGRGSRGNSDGGEGSGSREVTTCTICLDGIEEGCVVRTLPCAHQFHQACLDQWLKQRAVCPICQKPFK